MFPITNSKVLSYEPTWAPFPGFSVLFDNPGESLTRDGNLARIACRPEAESRLALYRALSDTVLGLGPERLRSQFGMCLLPPDSYHVTAYDCGNIGNATRTVPGFREALDSLLESLPGGWNEDNELVEPAAKSALANNEWAPIRLRFDRLANWDNQVIVARLAPADTASEERLGIFIDQRAQLANGYQSRFGFGTGPRFTPHISLAYFASEEGGLLAEEHLDEWDRQARIECAGLEICFESVHVYAFTDMATFLRCV